VPDSVGFVRDAEPFRRELVAHCYRMLGSIQDAEDLVQETYLRAWRSYGGFEGRSSIRTWLYQIATNRCLTELAKHSRRMLPSGVYDPEPDPDAYLEEAGTEVNWLQPVPDAMVTPDSADPAAIVAARESRRHPITEHCCAELAGTPTSWDTARCHVLVTTGPSGLAPDTMAADCGVGRPAPPRARCARRAWRPLVADGCRLTRAGWYGA